MAVALSFVGLGQSGLEQVCAVLRARASPCGDFGKNRTRDSVALVRSEANACCRERRRGTMMGGARSSSPLAPGMSGVLAQTTMATLGIHAIWTTYGTWLPGDPRGHWPPLFDFYGRLSEAGHKFNMPDATTLSRAQSLLKEPPKRLRPDEIALTAQTIADQLAPGMPGEFWTIRAAAIEPTHVHLLFGRLRDDIAKVVGRIKSRCSSEILKLPANAGRSRVWTEKYWKVYLFDEDGMYAVQKYVQEHNTRRGLPANPWDWVCPLM